MLTEQQIQTQIMNYLAARNILHWRNNTGAFRKKGRLITYGYKGSPDIIGIWPDGSALLIEVKDHAGSQHQSQKDFEKAVRSKSRADYLLVRSLEDVIEYCELMGY